MIYVNSLPIDVYQKKDKRVIKKEIRFSSALCLGNHWESMRETMIHLGLDLDIG